MLAHTGMLSSSASATGTPVNLAAVTDPGVDPLIPGGAALAGFVEVVLRQSPTRAAAAAEVAARLGAPALVNAAAVIANFQMMNRVADGTGMPVGRGSRIRNADVIARLGLERFDHSDGAPAR
ncbi:MAG: hypothetical protein KJ698_13445 [Actinobacteria bacterium]|nr:hypothetical protein [Actinomycetota bacterium]